MGEPLVKIKRQMFKGNGWLGTGWDREQRSSHLLKHGQLNRQHPRRQALSERIGRPTIKRDCPYMKVGGYDKNPDETDSMSSGAASPTKRSAPGPRDLAADGRRVTCSVKTDG